MLEHIVRVGRPKDIVISALGVREGLLYSELGAAERAKDGLIAASHELNLLRSRSPQHGDELINWTDRFMASSGIDETAEEKRLRRAACLLADIGWRAHPDYRGEQSLNIIANAAFVAVDHPGRTFLALAVFFRHVGLGDDELSPHVRELVSARMLDRARILGATLRVAYLVSASMPRVLPHVPLVVQRGKLRLELRGRFASLAGERLFNRLRQLARLIGREPVIGRRLAAEILLDHEAADAEHHQRGADDLHRRERPHQRLHVVTVARVLGAAQGAVRDDVAGVRAMLLKVGHHGRKAEQDAEDRKSKEAEQRQHHEREQAHRDDGYQYRNENEIVVHQTHGTPPAGFVISPSLAQRATRCDAGRGWHRVTRAFPRTGSCRTCRCRRCR